MRATTLNLFDLAFLAQTQVTITPETFGPTTRWWDANSLRTDYGLTNDAIIEPNQPWRDQSPNGLHARSTSTPASTKPVFKSDGLSEINGRPVVRLQGTKRLLFDGGDLVLSNDFTILAVYVAANDSIFISRAGGNTQVRINRSGANVASWFSGDSGTEQVSNLFASNPSFARMVGHRRTNNAVPATRVFHFFDNTNSVEPTGGQGGTSNIAFILSQIGIIDGGPLNIDIAELVIYDRALTTSNIQILYNQYFKPKFALP